MIPSTLSYVLCLTQNGAGWQAKGQTVRFHEVRNENEVIFRGQKWSNASHVLTHTRSSEGDVIFATSPSATQDIFKLWHLRSSVEESRREDAGTSRVRHFPPLSKGYLKSSTPRQSQHPAVWVWNQTLGQQTDASQWTPRRATSEPLAWVAQCRLSEEMSTSHGNSPFPPKSLLQSNSVFPSLGLWETGHWWWSTLSVGATWRWPKMPTPMVAPVCRHTLHEAGPRDDSPLIPPS